MLHDAARSKMRGTARGGSSVLAPRWAGGSRAQRQIALPEVVPKVVPAPERVTKRRCRRFRPFNRSYQVVFGAYLATDRSIRVIDPYVPQELQP